MTRELSSTLTAQSAIFLRESLNMLRRDSFDRHNPESTMGLEAVQIAFEWQANENKTRLHTILRTDAKRRAHELDMDTKFRDEVQSICEYVAGRKNTVWSPLTGKHISKICL